MDNQRCLHPFNIFGALKLKILASNENCMLFEVNSRSAYYPPLAYLKWRSKEGVNIFSSQFLFVLLCSCSEAPEITAC